MVAVASVQSVLVINIEAGSSHTIEAYINYFKVYNVGDIQYYLI